MPEPTTGNRAVIAMVLVFSALSLSALAVLIYTGVMPVPEDSRGIAALVVGVAAFADFLVAVWFFRMGQSS